jgi:hypothetical protein
MCFSAAASFGAGAVLSLAGAGALAAAQTKRQGLFAAIPFIFSLQQVSEGMLWLAVKDQGIQSWEPFFTYTFLVFALVLWPVYIPFTIWRLEENIKQKKILAILLGTGFAVSLCLVYVLLYYPVHVVATHHHIHFSFDFPEWIKDIIWLVSLFYFIATIVAPFVSGIRRMKWLGIVFLGSYIFSVVFFKGFLVSVWCYFAAVLSLVVVWIMWSLRGGQKTLI